MWTRRTNRRLLEPGLGRRGWSGGCDADWGLGTSALAIGESGQGSESRGRVHTLRDSFQPTLQRLGYGVRSAQRSAGRWAKRTKGISS